MSSPPSRKSGERTGFTETLDLPGSEAYVETADIPDDEEPSTILPHGTMLGRYELMELLGEGAVGRVYRARAMDTGEDVAVKVLRREHAKKKNVVGRFFREARTVNRIAHDNIVRVTDFVEDPSGANYLVMDLLRGTTLETIRKQHPVLQVETALDAMRQTASGVQAAHRMGVVHRDLKPENLFVTVEGRVKILDFGVAKLTESFEDSLSGGPNALVGTPEYMAPEQATGQKVDHRVDIYAMGVILYEVLSGAKPFVGDSLVSTLLRHVNHTPTRLTEIANLPRAIPEHVDRFVFDCLAKDPNSRPQTMEEAEARLMELAARI